MCDDFKERRNVIKMIVSIHNNNANDNNTNSHNNKMHFREHRFSWKNSWHIEELKALSEHNRAKLFKSLQSQVG